MITFVNAVNAGGDAQVSVQINGQHNFHFIMSHEAVFDFMERRQLDGRQVGELSPAGALHRHWEEFKPAIETVLHRHGSRFELLTTEMLNT
ncbi:hypothetical protein [Chromobacterium sp. CV08]|uniref:hypothetical protein n=1 Tax=Chromobacterium sp. CV08 TaxID=3133274 RepID=UPI003DA892E9